MYTERGVDVDRKVDSLGRVTIPKEVRKQLKISDNETVEMSVENGAIVLKPKDKSIVDVRRTTIFNIDEAEIKKLKQKYKPGDKVKCLNMNDDSHLVPLNMEGKVICVDDTGSVHVKWNNGQQLAALMNIDAIEKIN